NQYSDEGLQHAALSSRQRCSADDDGCHSGEEATVADQRVPEAELRRGQHATDGVEDARQGESDDTNRRDRNAGEGGKLLSATESINIAAESGVVLDDESYRETGERQPYAPGKAQRSPDSKSAYQWVVDPDRHAAEHRVGDSDADEPGAERRHKRRHLEP